MDAMQIFYDDYIVCEQPTPYRLLAQANPEDIEPADFLAWVMW